MLVKIFLALQVLAESLPISSSGHMLVVGYALHHAGVNLPFFEYAQSIDYLMHAPTLLLLLVYFRQEWIGVLRTGFFDDVSVMRYMWYLFCATSSTMCWYVALKIEFLPVLPAWYGFLFTALILAVFSKVTLLNNQKLSTAVCCFLGCVQGVALLPGISRLGVTYCAGRFLGLSHARAFLWSWMMQLPLCCGGVLLGLRDLWGTGIFAQLCTVPFVLWIVLATWGAYGLLCLTERILAYQKAWFFSLYLIVPLVYAWWYGL